MVLDRTARVKPGDTLLANMPDGSCEERRVSAVEVGDDEVRLTVAPFSDAPLDEGIWCVQADDLKPFQFRIQDVALTGPMEAQISAILEIPGKHAALADDGRAHGCAPEQFDKCGSEHCPARHAC
ncbi:hypothetical protein G6F65_022589 [Rhizopus arrhizus]|nr:hypothetical protein G6F65_022589 [Rhizopus arrhizus]